MMFKPNKIRLLAMCPTNEDWVLFNDSEHILIFIHTYTQNRGSLDG